MNGYKQAKIWMGVLLTVTTGALWFGVPSFATAVTIEDILNKIQQNIAGMNDMRAEIVTTIYMDVHLNTMTQRMKYYFKKPDKFKIETLPPFKQTILIIGEKMTIKTADGKTKTLDLKEMLGVDPNQQYFGADITKMLKNFNVTLNEALSDKTSNIYVLEFIPKKDSSTTLLLGDFSPPSKIRMFIDYNKGIIIKYTLHRKDDRLAAIAEVKEIDQIKRVWVPTTTQSTTFLPTGQQMKSEMNLENVQINPGIGNEEFQF